MRYRSYNAGMGSLWAIIATNVVLLIASYIRPEIVSVLGLSPAGFSSSPWTVMTAMFVHAGFFHIFANMLTLYFFGSFLIRLVGEGCFLTVYFLGGLVGNLFFLWLGPLFSLAVGASGAVFAIAGALTLLAPRLRVFIIPIPVPIPLWIAVIGGFLLLSFLPGVAWQAHLGGLLVGLGAGYLFRRKIGHFR